MANHSTLAQRDRDFDDGLLDVPAKDRKALRKLDAEKPPVKPRKKPTRKPVKTKAPLYTAKPPAGLWAVGTFVKYTGGSKLKNRWLKKGMVGRVFGYRPGRTGGGLYAVRFEGGATLLSVKRVKRVRTAGGPQ
jgi:hypothetical protein